MTEQRVPTRPIPASLVVARRAMVVAAAAMVIAALAVVTALLVEPDSDQAGEAALEQAQADAAAAGAGADAATAVAEAAAVIAEEAAAKAALAEEALIDALTEARGSVDPEVIARLESQLTEARNLAATALVAAETAATADQAPDPPAEQAVDAAEDAADDGSGADEDATLPEEAAAEEEAVPSGDAAPDEPTEPDGTDTAASVDLPGEPSEFGPAAGIGLAVVGIGYESALNLRDAPNGEIIARLDNVMDDSAVYVRDPDSDNIIATVDLSSGIVATGSTRQLPTTIWHELRVSELLGWASSTYLAPLGAGRDATDEVEEALGGTPTVETLIDLGRQVSALYESTGEVQSRTTISSRPRVFEALGDITLDVIGLPDDAVRGFRVHITAGAGTEASTPDDAGPYTLRSVTVTPICHSHRGVSDQGVCN